MAIFTPPSAHNVTSMRAFARMINRTDPFAVIDIGVTNGDGESGEFTIYADANQFPRLAAIADVINAVFADMATQKEEA